MKETLANEDVLKLQIDKDNSDALLDGEYSLLADERSRRSSEQTEYLKFVIIGIVSQFAIFIFELINSDGFEFEKLDSATLSVAMLALSGGVVVLTTLIFFFWLDHALTIAAIDKFFQHKEKQNNILGWYKFREHYSKNNFISLFGKQLNLMELKIQMFKTSIFASFLIPPVLFLMVASISLNVQKYKPILEWVNYGAFALFSLILIFGLMMWTASGRGIYFKHKKKKTKIKEPVN